MARLKEQYYTEVRPRLKERFGIENDMAVPRLTKIVVNMGVKGSVENKSKVDSAAKDLARITGQRPTIRMARKAISGFKLREGMPIGVAVTLRRGRMYDFLERLIHVALPRVRDFRGLGARGFDGRGNYTFGIREQVIFPEIDLDKVEKVTGMSVTLVTSAKDDNQGRALLLALGVPLRQ